MICLTFDVEERFHSHLTPGDAPRRWTAGDRIARLLDHLERHEHRATFFVVAELAEQYPDLARRMAGERFELCSHSYGHPRMDGEDRGGIIEDVRRSKDVLEQITGRAVRGFRAPSWSARRSDDWLWDLLVELDFRYDSSLFPFRTHLYGSFANPVRPFRLRPELVEVPPSVASFGPLRIPYGGGFYFRLYPGAVTRALIARDVKGGVTPIAYFHPWEFDPQSEPMESGMLSRLIGNVNSAGTWGKFTDLLDRYRTTTLDAMIDGLSLD